jgi:formylglycine-generating enzyme required for sulfatase activity
MLRSLVGIGFASVMPTEKEFTNSIRMKFVRIEPGTFDMGYGSGGELDEKVLAATERSGDRRIGLERFGKNGDFDEYPTHKVTISKPFYMGIYEVTNHQYEQFQQLHLHIRGKRGFSIDSDEAAVFISWNQAKAFCEWLSKKEGLPYRLPTEAEWEYACRAGTKTQYHTGDFLPDEYIKNPDNSWYPCPRRGRGSAEIVPLHVGKTQPNAWGLYDMHGNVEEWCEDWYGAYVGTRQSDPVGRVDGEFKVTRGGSHGTVGYYLRSSNRMSTLPEDKTFMIGFRVVIGDMPETLPLPSQEPWAFQKNVSQVVPSDISKGPDAAKPYFRGPLTFMKIKKNSFGPLFDRHNHQPAITDCPNGDLLTTWYTCVSERGRELAMAASRLPYGSQVWQDASPFFEAADRNDHGNALMYDGDRTIYHFVGLSNASTWGPLDIVMRKSIDNGATWTRGQLITGEHQRRSQVIESAFITREGYFVLPCDASPSSSGGTAIHISKDNGATWNDPGGTIAGIHAGVAQLDDGRLIAFGRGDNIKNVVNGVEQQCMPRSISNDMGKTWEYSPTEFPSVGGGKRLTLIKLQEGPLLMCAFANGQPPVYVTDVSGKKREVSGIFAALSYDGGQTWPDIRLITDDGPDREFISTDRSVFTMGLNSAEPKGYFSICQAKNGLIHLISSKNLYTFNLKWAQTSPPARPVKTGR